MTQSVKSYLLQFAFGRESQLLWFVKFKSLNESWNDQCFPAEVFLGPETQVERFGWFFSCTILMPILKKMGVLAMLNWNFFPGGGPPDPRESYWTLVRTALGIPPNDCEEFYSHCVQMSAWRQPWSLVLSEKWCTTGWNLTGEVSDANKRKGVQQTWSIW